MIQHRSMLKVADNSGAKLLQVIHILGGSKRKFGFMGDILNCVVKVAAPNGQVKSSEIVKAVLVRAKKNREEKTVRISDFQKTQQWL